MSPAVVPHMDKVFSIVRKIYDREPYGQHGGPGRERGYMEHISEYHFKQQFILVKAMRRNYDIPRINS